MNDQDFALRLHTVIADMVRTICLEVVAEAQAGKPDESDPPAKLREQLDLIKAKENATVKEAALLLSCSESHVRKMVRFARQKKSNNPIPFISMEGVTVLPVDALLAWASPRPQVQALRQEAA
jgi:hypothetical protein